MAHPPTVFYRFNQISAVKSETLITFHTGGSIKSAWKSKRSVLVHDVHEDIPHPDFTASDSFDRKQHLFFVIKSGKALIAIQRQLILRAYLPRCNWNPAAFLWLNRQVRPCLASLEKQFIIRDLGSTDDSCGWAAHPHLPDVQVTAISNVVSFFHIGIRPFRRGYPSTTLRPPKRSEVRWQEANSCDSFKRRPCPS